MNDEELLESAEEALNQSLNVNNPVNKQTGALMSIAASLLVIARNSAPSVPKHTILVEGHGRVVYQGIEIVNNTSENYRFDVFGSPHNNS